ncbi:hypothetical protein LCGC14_1591020 [marine sediment metagenome]|uniref:Ice-binding protein C-terminal domain-containing protein n=1 Tax=marine sediment metagenome TaxID=412755 RepID=A0A0F9IEC8_9ZZZZ
MVKTKTLQLVAMLVLGLAAAWSSTVPIARGSIITDADIVPFSGNEVGSGNGTLDLLMLTESAGGTKNLVKDFNGDDAGIDMVNGQTATASASYITSMGEVRDFYRLNFPDGLGGSEVTEMVLFVDINQTGKMEVVLETLTVIIDYDADFGDARDDPAANDISSALQNATGTGFTGGSVAASLDGAKTLPLNEQGAGWADYAIFLGINPFDEAFSDDTRILVHWQSSGHDDGGESAFLDGRFQASDVPEPATLSVLILGALAVVVRRRRRA